MRFVRAHYAWVVAVTFVALLTVASVRAAPGILITPLEAEFGWDRATISAAIAVSIVIFGLGGPLSGTLVARFGPRRLILFGCVFVAAGLAAMLRLSSVWQFFLFWGVIIGIGTGAIGTVLGATIAHYHLMFISAALFGFIAAGLALRIAPQERQLVAAAA